METVPRPSATRVQQRPHSLGKLIEWKPYNQRIIVPINFKSPLAGETNWMETYLSCTFSLFSALRPHSLGKLIEWKRNTCVCGHHVESRPLSPLAGETNWMETSNGNSEMSPPFRSPLAGETNWMETLTWRFEVRAWRSPLAGETNWMETGRCLGRLVLTSSSSLSPLAGETNWMETKSANFLINWFPCPHSLGKLIEWKLIYFRSVQNFSRVVPTRWGN